MRITNPANSIRIRLQIWYAIMMVAAIGSFASVLYFQARRDRLRTVDARLEAAANYLEATLGSMPAHALERLPPPRLRRSEPHNFEPLPYDKAGGYQPRRPETANFPAPPPEDAPLTDPHDRRFSETRHGSGPPFPPQPSSPFSGDPLKHPPGIRKWRPPISLPRSILDPPDVRARDQLYFSIWRKDGSILAASGEQDTLSPSFRGPPAPGDPPGFRWRAGDRRETLRLGPGATRLLVGRHVGRELAELRTFLWRLSASGLLVLGMGLAGGWTISSSITRPVAAISRTASEISASNLSRRIETAGLDQELVELATILNQMFARLEAAFDRQSRFTSDASHELRTPLAIIHSHAELALSNPRSTEQYRETLTACLKAAARMANLVDGLLTLARSDAGQLDVYFSNVDLCRVVEEVVDQFRPQSQAARISMVSTHAEPLMVRGDATLLERISSNLLTNALTYTPAGGRVAVSLRVDADMALLIVEDTGCGIAARDQNKVFERFFRADKSRSRTQGGYGLGLAICMSLVQIHRGRIEFSSEPGQGTRFEVRLPLAGNHGQESIS